MGVFPTTGHPEYKVRPDGPTMKALALLGTRDVRLIDAPIPDISEPDDVILMVTGTTICGSDLHLFNAEVVALQKGAILGHEARSYPSFMGIVDEVGPNVTNPKVGQRGVALSQIACGECEYCRQKLSSFCDRTNHSTLQNAMYRHRDAGFFSYSHFTGGFAGGQAEYVHVPKSNVNLLPIPDEVSGEKALYLYDVLCTAYHCVLDTGVTEGDVGLGPIGLCLSKFAQLKGAKRVIGVDRVPESLKKTEELGFETVYFSKHSDVVKRFKELVPGGLDVALDCGTFHQPKSIIHKVEKTLMLETDVSEIVNEMIMSARKRGRCGIIAAYVAIPTTSTSVRSWRRASASLATVRHLFHKWWKEILYDLIIPGKFDPTFMISHRVPIDDFPKLYLAFDKREGGVEKVFVETKFSSPPSPGCPGITRVNEWALV